MAMIKCKECGKSISDKASTCPNCGCPVEPPLLCSECGKEVEETDETCKNCGNPLKEEKSKKKDIVKDKKTIFITITVVAVVFLLLIILLVTGSKDQLVCKSYKNSSAGEFDFTITYTFKDGKISTLSGKQYAKPSDEEVAEYLWTVSNNNQEQYNYYDGMSYKASYSEDHAVTMVYSIDAEKAPKMFETVATLCGVDGISIDSTKEEVRSIFESNEYTCK